MKRKKSRKRKRKLLYFTMGKVGLARLYTHLAE